MEKELAIELIGGKQFVKLKSELQEMNPADIAFLVEELKPIFRICSKASLTVNSFFK